MTESIGSEKKDANSLIKFALLIVLALVVGSIVLRWLMALAVPILFFINRDLVLKIFNKIISLYQDNPIYGILATIAAFLCISPFSVFLFFRTIYNVVILGKNPVPTKTEIASMVATTKKGIDKLKIESKDSPKQEKDSLMTVEEIRAKFKDEF